MISEKLTNSLQEVLDRKNISQKELRVDTKTPSTTVSEHVTGKQAVPINKAVEYTRAINDSKFSLEVAYLFFGTISSMTGDKYKKTPLALHILQKKETNERDAKVDRVLEILTLKSNMFDQEDKDIIYDYASEFLDEIMVETTMLVSLLDICDRTLMDCVHERMKYWQKVGYMRGD